MAGAHSDIQNKTSTKHAACKQPNTVIRLDNVLYSVYNTKPF